MYIVFWCQTTFYGQTKELPPYNLINYPSVSLNHEFIFKFLIKCPSLFALRMH